LPVAPFVLRSDLIPRDTTDMPESWGAVKGKPMPAADPHLSALRSPHIALVLGGVLTLASRGLTAPLANT
jgi:hypothetical protein